MSLEQIRQLLLSFDLSPNKLLGQNFMVEPAFFPKLASYSQLGASDVVLDAGAGFGFLAQFLSNKCKGVVAAEKDPQVAAVLREQTKDLPNVMVVEGDVLKASLPPFNKVIALPPYYLSTQLITWVLERRVDCAVLVVQREFAQRLTASVGTEQYGWLTVVATQQAQAELLDDVPHDCFYPQPEVDSVILRLKPWSTKPFGVKNHELFVQLTKWLFTERNRKLAKAAAPFMRTHLKLTKQHSEELAANLPFCDKRPRQLNPKDFGEIADALPN
jgi:16S rRNA (adenine1518-N6/adenine1519-N6)-dimethyltransferase